VLNEHLVRLWTNVHSIEHVSIRLYQSDNLTQNETILIKNGLFMWCGIALEKASAVLSESNFRVFGGRMLKHPASILSHPEGFSSFLGMLDEVDDAINDVISSKASQFKAEVLYEELHRILVCWSADLWRTLSPLLKSIIGSELSVDCVRFLRQLSNLLSKIHIDRADLLESSISEYRQTEELLFAETSVQSARSDEYWDMILRIRSVLRDTVASFKMDAPMPKHGPGAVADPSVKSKLGKYLTMGYDERINYMLRKETAEEMVDYSPFPLQEQSRTSRVVFVPKSWKKLRGISAEPAGLQFFQQAVLSGITESVSRTDLSRIINLRDQDTSRHMALRGSRNGYLATIDLSAASDSVTLRLVKDIFGSTSLCRWLLATRSTHTLIENQSMEILKFAPMGSACCFPVECLVFAGIALASAAKHFGHHSVHYRDFRVFGDDIICPAFMSECIMDDLTGMGFTVNSDKSYISGDYRESCGMDAWRGFDVTPLKLKDFSFDFNSSNPLSYEHHSRVVAYLNFLYSNGYKGVRSFFLKKLLNTTILARKQRFWGKQSLVFGDGSRGTLASCQPDNFHLERIDLTGLFRSGFKTVKWKPRFPRLSQEHELLLDEVNYFERLLSSRTQAEDEAVTYDLEYFRRADSEVARKDTQGMRMIPTMTRHDPWSPMEHHVRFLSSVVVDVDPDFDETSPLAASSEDISISI